MHDGDMFEWLRLEKSGVFIVGMVQNQVVNHSVVVCWSRGVIVDSAERFHLGLSAESFRLCGAYVFSEVGAGIHFSSTLVVQNLY